MPRATGVWLIMSNTTKYPLTPVILSGGTGARLWPLSRENHPKQFHSLIGDDTLLSLTLDRAWSLPARQLPILVGNAAHQDLILNHLPPRKRLPPTDILLEPVSRNTAPALTLAALHAQNREYHEADPLLLILPSDHLIENTAKFAEAISAATQSAIEGNIVTFGVQPTYPEPDYGYILPEEVDATATVRKVDYFHEKPGIDLALEFTTNQTSYWNSGMFLLRASVLLDSMTHYEPDIVETVRAAYASAAFDYSRGMLTVDEAIYRTALAVSFDNAVMDRTDQATVVRLDAGWRDVGTWLGWSCALDADQDGNVLTGRTLTTQAVNCFVGGDTQRLIALVGTQNLAVVDTPDALLLADWRHLDQLKDLTRRLKAEEWPEHRDHATVHRPWGHFTTAYQGPGVKVKRLVVRPGELLSLQSHSHRSEHWVVIRGRAQVTKDAETFTLEPNEATVIPTGVKHRLANPYSDRLEVLEVQTGAYLDEADIIRYEDAYGRPTASHERP